MYTQSHATKLGPLVLSYGDIEAKDELINQKELYKKYRGELSQDCDCNVAGGSMKQSP